MALSDNRALRLNARKMTAYFAAVAAAHKIVLQDVVTSGKTHECPECRRVLAIAEVIERICAHCGNVTPEEVNL